MNNENLEKIKQLCDVEVPYNEVCSIHANALGEIQEAAERMAREIERLENEMNTLMNKNLPEEMREMHRRQKEYIQHQRQHLKNMTRKYKNSLESKQKALWGMSKAIDSRDFDIARLKAELEKKEKVLNELREPAGVEYNDLEEMFDEKHIDRDGPDMVLVPTSHWNKIQTAFYVGRTQMLDFKSELEKRPEVVYCEGCIYKNQCKAAVIFQESTPKMEGPFKFYYLKFCSYGQRRESEEGK
jgi:vacuolar-type H+-ATPase subunit I/STV1